MIEQARVAPGRPGIYGWRARIGLILPADNVLMEPELNALRIDGVTFHGLRLTATEPDRMRNQAVELAGTLVELGLDAAVYACAETSFNGGSEVRQSLAGLVAAGCGLPTVTATDAMLAAAAHLGITNAAVVTPYNDDSGRHFEETLRGNGIRIASALHRDFARESDDARVWYLTNRQPPSEVYAMARKADVFDADGIVIAATNLPTFDIIDHLERDAGKPVITSNQSIVWWLLRQLKISTAAMNLGSLMRSRGAA
ncbi:hypothetical protein ABT297_28395 [Dactylosporangium sp. NPDC000555]|uniref:maleate cis-trans isomerase family protein n=1 Tax=Dactylosporangium sp. NPDC000555 TaxID=3154260 RepID=UPI0033271768